MPNTVEGLKAEITQLEAILAEKKEELREVIQSSNIAKEASRDTTAEIRLGQALMRVLINVERIRVCVYPDKTIIILPLMHSSFSTVSNLFAAFLEQNSLKIEKIRPRFGDIQSIRISFPSAHLPELEKGIKLSEGVDLANDRCSLQADC